VPAAVYPAPIELVMTQLDQSQLRSRRRQLVQQARGRVLELGGAGGVNLEHYRPDQVTEVVVAGPDAATRARLRRAVARRDLHVDVRTPSDVGTGYDTIVAAFTLSATADLDRELRSLGRLLAPGGRLLFLDHSPRRPAGVATELSRPLWRMMADGFVPGRDLPGALRHSGLIIVDIERFGLTTLTLPLRSCVAGVARPQRPGGARRVEGDRRVEGER
jgi:SAM-dependent methyltransferase